MTKKKTPVKAAPAPSVQERLQLAAPLLASLIAREGLPTDLTPAKLRLVAQRALALADALVEAAVAPPVPPPSPIIPPIAAESPMAK